MCRKKERRYKKCFFSIGSDVKKAYLFEKILKMSSQLMEMSTDCFFIFDIFFIVVYVCIFL